MCIMCLLEDIADPEGAAKRRKKAEAEYAGMSTADMAKKILDKPSAEREAAAYRSVLLSVASTDLELPEPRELFASLTVDSMLKAADEPDTDLRERKHALLAAIESRILAAAAHVMRKRDDGDAVATRLTVEVEDILLKAAARATAAPTPDPTA